MIWPQTYHFFVYRVQNQAGASYDERLPDGGLTVRGWNELAIIERAFSEAQRRFPCKPWEILVLVKVTDKTRCRQALLMERDWEQAYRKFEELMTVS